MEVNKIQGSGGKQRNPTEEQDTLFSRSTAKVLDALCEGEIEGLAKLGARAIYLDNTQVQNPDGTLNFQGNFQFRTGTQEQTGIEGISNTVESEITVNTPVTFSGGPVTRTITDPDIDAVRVTITVPQLVIYEDSGDIRGSSIQLKIDISTDGGNFANRVNDTISGKTTGGYQKQYYISLSPASSWQVRVERITPDSTSEKKIDEFVWTSYTEITEQRLRYPNTALVGSMFDAEQFTSIPSRAFLVRGRKIKIPSNMRVNGDGGLEEDDGLSFNFPGGGHGKVNTLFAYHGVWDGTFNYAWNNNPAWVLYDLLTNTRYGCGINESMIDKWTLYQIGQYCDQPVPSGLGYFEPRFTCNCYIQNPDEAYNVINTLSSVFRGQSYYSAGALTFIQDAPGTPTRTFTNSNVVDGVFGYQGVAQRARHTVALVSWNNPELLFQTDLEPVEDLEGITKYGYRETQVTAFGCTSRGQAQRVGKWILAVEKMETETVTFSAGMDAIPVRPGEIIEIVDENRTINAVYGRTPRDSENAWLYLDKNVDFVEGGVFSVQVQTGERVEFSTIHLASSSPNRVTLPGLQNYQVKMDTVWAYRPPGQVVELYRVIGATQSEPHIFEITATIHKPAKFAAADDVNLGTLPKPPRPPNAVVSVPVNPVATSYVVIKNDTRFVNVNLQWEHAQYDGRRDEFVNKYEVQIKAGANETWRQAQQTHGTSYDWTNLIDGQYYCRVRSIDFRGGRSNWVEATPVDTPQPPVLENYVPEEGVEGDTVVLTGLHFTGATQVTFNDVAAEFEVDSPTQITATVPTGSTTGLVCVRTRAGRSCY